MKYLLQENCGANIINYSEAAGKAPEPDDV